jgi:hypothetical protein
MNSAKRYTVDFSIDHDKASAIGRILLDQFYNKRGFFKDYEMPEYILPLNLVHRSKEHALYLTYVISIDYMTDAVKLWRRSREEYQYNPQSFDSTKILDLSDSQLMTLIKRIGGRYPKTGASTWRKTAKILLANYDDDPRNITKEPNTIEEIKQKIDVFPYLRGRKLSNFYLRAMGENGLFKISNFDELDIPVDIQVARFTLYTGVLKLLSGTFRGCVHEEPLRGLIEEAWREAAHELETYPWKLDEPIWTIGSKLCSMKKCNKCPVGSLCDKTRGTRFTNAIAYLECNVNSDRIKMNNFKSRKASTRSGMYVVFEDLARASGPKVHNVDCFYHQRWLKNPTTTTTWHGPFESEEEAWRLCQQIARKSGMKPSKHSCV